MFSARGGPDCLNWFPRKSFRRGKKTEFAKKNRSRRLAPQPESERASENRRNVLARNGLRIPFRA